MTHKKIRVSNPQRIATNSLSSRREVWGTTGFQTLKGSLQTFFRGWRHVPHSEEFQTLKGSLQTILQAKGELDVYDSFKPSKDRYKQSTSQDYIIVDNFVSNPQRIATNFSTWRRRGWST